MMRLAIFDLDYTIWQPEMYQLYGKPRLTPLEKNNRATRMSPLELRESRTIKEGHILTDGDRGSPIRVFEGASIALAEIQQLREEGHDIRAAVASRTDEPAWARICMKYLLVRNRDKNDGSEDALVTLQDCFEPNLVEISYGSKVQHLQRLRRKTGIPYDDMCFFDNENWNIRDVSKHLPEVKCYYTPNGMTREAWEEAKRDFGMDR